MKSNFITKNFVTLLIFAAILTSANPSQAAQLIIRAIECKSVSTGISAGVLNAIFQPLAAVSKVLISTALPGDLSEASKVIAEIPDVAQAIDSSGGGDPDDLYLSLSNQPKRDLAIWPARGQDYDIRKGQIVRPNLKLDFSNAIDVNFWEYDSGSGDDFLGRLSVNESEAGGVKTKIVYNPDEGNVYVVEYEVIGVAPTPQAVEQQWQQVIGCAKKIAAGGGKTWVLGCVGGGSGYQIFSRNGSNWDLVPGAAVDIAVESNGTPWVVNADGQIFQRSGNSWQLVPGCAKKIAAGSKVWVLGCDRNGSDGYQIFSWNGSGWDLIRGAVEDLAVDSKNIVWAVNGRGEIFRNINFRTSGDVVKRGDPWTLVPGCAKKIAVGGSKVWILGCASNGSSGYEIFSMNNSNWDLVPGAAVEIAVDASGNPWVVNAKGQIFRAP
ncbi:tectonin domain-containing protein [Dendronalium sp. ChiSLP03b]|uniref:tectonin domain-containing protein n=1 Tax=Dendronalium sp. ChiSLP03b TaxID=3075381 RepID=UPI002AD54A12|nr:tectonin domain-containing protein [Dendronalium sp. ChiSLP03b]MDZ8206807.1 tectonin domain-containing protein [Dendronalium sp. ChiSLP03b]